jgi:hypothetical protein
MMATRSWPIQVFSSEAEERKIRAAIKKSGQTLGEYTRRALLAYASRLDCDDARIATALMNGNK